VTIVSAPTFKLVEMRLTARRAYQALEHLTNLAAQPAACEA
jgi:hypothetical protein